jgi:hypothetical protein
MAVPYRKIKESRIGGGGDVVGQSAMAAPDSVESDKGTGTMNGRNVWSTSAGHERKIARQAKLVPYYLLERAHNEAHHNGCFDASCNWTLEGTMLPWWGPIKRGRERGS